MDNHAVLENTPLFQGVGRERLPALLKYLSAWQRAYEKDEMILYEGDSVDHVGVLLTGSVRSIKTDMTGKQVIVALVEPGGYIGVLLAASRRRKSPVSVQAAEAAEVLFIPFDNILNRTDCPEHAALLKNLFDGLAEKALVLHDRNDCLIKPTIREKVLTYLSMEAARAGSDSFDIPFGRGAMAEYLDVNSSALSRELSWMKRDGLIDFQRNRFKLIKK